MTTVNNQGSIEQNQSDTVNIINYLTRPTRNRCCSFCKSRQHVITYCDDARLQDFEALCNDKKLSFENMAITYAVFEEWLVDYYLENKELVKAFAIKKCGSTTRTNIQQNIENIMIYIYGENYELRDILEDDFITFSNYDHFVLFQSLSVIRLMHNDYLLNLESQQGRTFMISTNIQPIDNDTKSDCECNICYETVSKTNIVKLNCDHEFCDKCVKKTLQTCAMYTEPTCAFCRSPITSLTYENEEVNAEFAELIS